MLKQVDEHTPVFWRNVIFWINRMPIADWNVPELLRVRWGKDNLYYLAPSKHKALFSGGSEAKLLAREVFLFILIVHIDT